MAVIVRKAERKDCVGIMELKKELAIHQNLGDLPMLTPHELERDGFDTQPPCFQCLVAEDESDQRILGYGLYFVAYPIWEGAAIYLEDLCTSAAHRGKGIGSLILKELVKVAIEGNYARITLDCKNSNHSAIKFYTKHLGEDFTQKEGWHLWKLDNAALQKLAQF